MVPNLVVENKGRPSLCLSLSDDVKDGKNLLTQHSLDTGEVSLLPCLPSPFVHNFYERV
uniref:Uncharacterized protein n=1 Tax=Cucumis melo TaxID=3656 RepID=A0A9I9EDV4_CUCME